MADQSLVERLERFRLENRITQVDLAEMLGVKFITVSRWLNGHYKPNKIQSFHIEKLLAGRKRTK